MYRHLVALLCVAMIGGCANIEHKSAVQQPMGKSLVAGAGDVVIRVTTSQSMPNVVGKADIWGRTTPTGETTVTYRGLSEGKAYFERRSIDIRTGATTMNSSPLILANTSRSTSTGTVGTTSFRMNTTTTGAPIVVAPNTPQAQISERGGQVIAISVSSLPATFLVEGKAVRVLQASEGSVSYVIDNAAN